MKLVGKHNDGNMQGYPRPGEPKVNINALHGKLQEMLSRWHTSPGVTLKVFGSFWFSRCDFRVCVCVFVMNARNARTAQARMHNFSRWMRGGIEWVSSKGAESAGMAPPES